MLVCEIVEVEIINEFQCIKTITLPEFIYSLNLDSHTTTWGLVRAKKIKVKNLCMTHILTCTVGMV